MKEKARLTQLASRMNLKPAGNSDPAVKQGFGSGNAKSANAKTIDPNPPHGERGEFRKVTVTLPPTIYESLVNESSRRKIAGEKDHLLASIIREAVVAHLT